MQHSSSTSWSVVRQIVLDNVIVCLLLISAHGPSIPSLMLSLASAYWNCTECTISLDDKHPCQHQYLSIQQTRYTRWLIKSCFRLVRDLDMCPGYFFSFCTQRLLRSFEGALSIGLITRYRAQYIKVSDWANTRITLITLDKYSSYQHFLAFCFLWEIMCSHICKVCSLLLLWKNVDMDDQPPLIKFVLHWGRSQDLDYTF